MSPNLIKTFANELIDYLRIKGYAFNYLNNISKLKTKSISFLIFNNNYDSGFDDLDLLVYETKTPYLKNKKNLILKFFTKKVEFLDDNENILYRFDNYNINKDFFLEIVSKEYKKYYTSKKDILDYILSDFDSYSINKTKLKNILSDKKKDNIKSILPIIKLSDVINNIKIPIRHIEENDTNIKLYFGSSIISWEIIIDTLTGTTNFNTLSYSKGSKNGSYSKTQYYMYWSDSIKKTYSEVLSKSLKKNSYYYTLFKYNSPLNDVEIKQINILYKNILLYDVSNIKFKKLK